MSAQEEHVDVQQQIICRINTASPNRVQAEVNAVMTELKGFVQELTVKQLDERGATFLVITKEGASLDVTMIQGRGFQTNNVEYESMQQILGKFSKAYRDAFAEAIERKLQAHAANVLLGKTD